MNESVLSRSQQKSISWVEKFRHFVVMSRPTITMLVVVTVVPGALCATSGLPSVMKVVWAMLGTFLASSAAAAVNQILESDSDGYMERTKDRPLQTGEISKKEAYILSSLFLIPSFIILYALTEPLAAWISLASFLFYVIGYTIVLKPNTDQNIVIGGVAGAVGPLIGSAAMTGGLDTGSIILGSLIFFWTPSHFWALAIRYKDDYKKANLPMLPVVRGEAYTRKAIFYYTLTLAPIVSAFYITGFCSLVALIVLMGLTLYYIYTAYQLYHKQDNSLALNVFHTSCMYLFLVFTVVSFDRIYMIL